MSVWYKFNNKDFVLREEGDQALLFDKKLNAFYNLNKTAKDILLGIEKGYSSAAIVSKMIQRYNLNNIIMDVARDFEEFIKQSQDGGIILVDNQEDAFYRFTNFHDVYLPVKPEELKFIETNLPKTQSTILDIGCGEGCNLEFFRKYHKMIGIDIDTNSLRKAKEIGNVVAGDVKYIPVGRQSYDAVLLTGHVLGYLNCDQRKKALDEINESLKKGGHFIFGVWKDTAVPLKGQDLIDVKDMNGNPCKIHFFSEQEINEIIARYEYLEDSLFLSRNGDIGDEYAVYCCRK